MRRVRNPTLRADHRTALLAGALALFAVASAVAQPATTAPATPVARGGSAIFLHPDGMGANTWSFARLASVGPDGRLAWDRLPATAVYVGPMLDQVDATSNGGATSHAWGVRAAADSFGRIDGQRIAKARSGADVPLMVEAKRAGKSIGIVNSASVTDAGTGVHLADVAARRNHESIAEQMLSHEPEVLMGGGEQWFLPEGVQGVHGPGRRKDGRNLVEEARAKGYVVVRTRAELEQLPPRAARVLGLFAAADTFEDGDERKLGAAGRPAFRADAPRYDEMVAVAVRVLERNPKGFFLVAEEEATDNLGGDNNAPGVLDAALGADRAIAQALALRERRPDLTVIVASDSDCGGVQPTGAKAGQPVPATAENGAPQDGAGGPGTEPFLAAPDRNGRRLPFLVSWASRTDLAGGLVARGAGPGAKLVTGTIDSTDVYSALYYGLFGREPGAAR
jgi:alkaline phosphatase